MTTPHPARLSLLTTRQPARRRVAQTITAALDAEATAQQLHSDALLYGHPRIAAFFQQEDEATTDVGNAIALAQTLDQTLGQTQDSIRLHTGLERRIQQKYLDAALTSAQRNPLQHNPQRLIFDALEAAQYPRKVHEAHGQALTATPAEHQLWNRDDVRCSITIGVRKSVGDWLAIFLHRNNYIPPADIANVAAQLEQIQHSAVDAAIFELLLSQGNTLSERIDRARSKAAEIGIDPSQHPTPA